MTDAADRVLGFLRGAKIGERLPSVVAEQLYVPTSVDGEDWVLEDALIDALAAGRHVVVAGSAGGGKTTLINVLRPRAAARGLTFVTPKASKWREAVDRPADVVAVIPDLTAVKETQRKKAVAQLARG